MPLSAMVTPLSLYMQDQTIFDGLQLPVPPTNPTDYPDLYVQGFQIDRQVLIDNLLMETGELNVLYPDPVFFKYAVTNWSKKELPVWQETFNTLFYRYNPLWNKDGSVKETAKDITSNLTTGSRSRAGSTEQSSGDTSSETETHDLTDARSSELRSSDTERRSESGTEISSMDQIGSESKSGGSMSSTSGTTDSSGSTTDTLSETAGMSKAGSTTHGGGTVTENQVSAYNDSAYANRDKSTLTDTQSVTDSESGGNYTDRDSTQITSNTEGKSETTTSSDNGNSETGSGETSIRQEDRSSDAGSDRHETGSDTSEHSGSINRIGDSNRTSSGAEQEQEDSLGTSDGTLDHSMERIEQGNIGLTTTMQLIAEQRELVKLNIYDLIIEAFKCRFCLLIY